MQNVRTDFPLIKDQVKRMVVGKINLAETKKFEAGKRKHSELLDFGSTKD